MKLFRSNSKSPWNWHSRLLARKLPLVFLIPKIDAVGAYHKNKLLHQERLVTVSLFETGTLVNIYISKSG